MTRAWFPLLFSGCSALGACTEEIPIGDTRDADEVREDKELERSSQELKGSWLGTVFGVPTKITFTPGRLPRSGDWVVDCADNSDECNPLSWLSQASDAGSSGLTFQPTGKYELLDQFSDGMTALCVLTSGEGQSLSLNISLSPDGESLVFRMPIPIPAMITFQRE